MAVLCMWLLSYTLLAAVSAMADNAVLGIDVPETLNAYVCILG